MKVNRISRRGVGWALLVAALITAALFRALWLSEIRHTPQYEMPVLDAGFHHVWALAWSSGDWQDRYGQRVSSIPEEAYFRPPGYAAFLSVIYKLLGSGVAPLCIQLVLGLFTLLVIYGLGAEIDPLAGGAGAMIYALYWPALCYETALLDTSLTSLLLAGTLWLLSKWYRNFNISDLAGAGILLGFCAVVRPNVLLFAPVAAVMVFVRSWRNTGCLSALKSCTVLTAATVIIIMPVTIRNWVVAGQPILVSTNGGINFYIGNGPDASGVFCSRLGELGVYNQTDDSGELARGLSLKLDRPVSDQAVGRILFKEACAHIAAHPGRWLRLMAVKLGYFFGEPGVRLNVDAYGHREIGGVLTRLPFAFAFLAAFGLAGLAVALFKGRSEGLLGMAAVIVWVLSVVLFFVTDQYRQVAAPLLAAGSGMGIFYAGEALFRRRWLTGSSMIVVSVLLLFLTSRNWNGYEMDRVFEMLNDANALSTAGRDDEAQKLYAEIIEMPLTWQLRGERSANVFELSSAAKAANALAVQDFRKRDWRSAEQRYSLSLAWQPDYEVMGNYGVCLLALGRMPEAVRIFEESLKGQPFAEHTRLYYAEALFKSGRRAAAIDELKRLAQSKSEFGIKARSQLEKLERE